MTVDEAIWSLQSRGPGTYERRRAAEAMVLAELERLREVERRVNALADRHTSPTGQHPVAVAELRNAVEPGSAPMYPAEPGYAATCSICMPNGDGHSSWRGSRA